MRIAIPPGLSPNLFAGRDRPGRIVDLSGPTMGTTWSARIVDAPAHCASVILAVLSQVIGEMSNWEAGSDVSRFNRAAVGGWVALPPWLLHVLRAGLEVARQSDGAFDPAIGRLVHDWGFGPSSDAAGAPATAARPPWRSIDVGPGRARRRQDVHIDLSGIAKGFAVDAMADALGAIGLRHFLVEIGGELRGAGVKPNLQPWWIDVEAPPGLAVPALRVALCGLSIATSGDYRRFRIDGGERLSHSIDPAGGRPVANDVASVTVLHESAMLADAWATAITVMGHERGMALATRQGLAVRLVRRQGDRGVEYMTPALAAMLG